MGELATRRGAGDPRDGTGGCGPCVSLLLLHDVTGSSGRASDRTPAACPSLAAVFGALFLFGVTGGTQANRWLTGPVCCTILSFTQPSGCSRHCATLIARFRQHFILTEKGVNVCFTVLQCTNPLSVEDVLCGLRINGQHWLHLVTQLFFLTTTRFLLTQTLPTLQHTGLVTVHAVSSADFAKWKGQKVFI